MLIVWKDEFSIDNASIDADHQTIIWRINEIIELIRTGSDALVISHSLRELHRVTVAHFFREESLQAISSFPHSEEHRAEHKKLLSSLQECVTAIENTAAHDDHAVQSDKLKQCKVFLYRWILSHILVEDKKMREYVHKMRCADEEILTRNIEDLIPYVDMISGEGKSATHVSS
jgi:hemerythrin